MWPVGIKSNLQWVRARITFQNFQSSLIPWTRTFQLHCFSSCSNMQIFSLHQIYPSNLGGEGGGGILCTLIFSLQMVFQVSQPQEKGSGLLELSVRPAWLEVSSAFCRPHRRGLVLVTPRFWEDILESGFGNATTQSTFSYIIKAPPVQTVSLLLLSPSPLL